MAKEHGWKPGRFGAWKRHNHNRMRKRRRCRSMRKYVRKMKAQNKNVTWAAVLPTKVTPDINPWTGKPNPHDQSLLGDAGQLVGSAIKKVDAH